MHSQETIILQRINFSLLTESERIHVYSVLKKHDVTLSTILSSHRLALHDVTAQRAEEIEQELLQKLPETCPLSVTYVKACPGLEQCKYGVADGISIGKRISALTFSGKFPAKVKVSIAGCSICCTEPYLRDVGLIAKKSGWTVIFGGNAGGKPRIGDVLGENLSEDLAVALVQRALRIYCDKAGPHQRTARFMEEFHTDSFRRLLKVDEHSP